LKRNRRGRKRKSTARELVPVLLVDDVAASAPFLLLGAARVRHKLSVSLHYNYFTIVNKVGRGFRKDNQHTENYLDNELIPTGNGAARSLTSIASTAPRLVRQFCRQLMAG
jgi:hypothetical protein